MSLTPIGHMCANISIATGQLWSLALEGRVIGRPRHHPHIHIFKHNQAMAVSTDIHAQRHLWGFPLTLS